MDKNGYFWFSGGAAQKQDFRQCYEMAEYVILEINERILEGSDQEQECIHISQADMVVAVIMMS